MEIFIIFLIAGCIAYTAGVIIFFAALGRTRPGTSSEKPFVSVIIAARDERESIGACLASIIDQDYSENCYEVIVVDDRSTDGTKEVVDRFREAWSSLDAVRIDSVPEGVSSKKHALSRAIERAKGEIILQTDADCFPPCTWISGMVRGFENGVGLVAGLAPYLKVPGALNSFVRHEYLWNAALSAGSIILGNGTHASGRNLAFRKDIFKRLGGYGYTEKILSGDDTLLLHRIQQIPDYRAATMSDTSTHVYTYAPGDFRTFIRQRVRHMSTGKFFDPYLIAVGCAIYGFHILLLMSFFLMCFSLKVFGVFIAVFLWKAIMDGLMAWRTSAVLGLEVQWRRLLINEVFLILYMAVMPFLGFFVPVSWKEK
jgi:cellulose synthase/poly-beta-1,6-N-acetylglucosamine synthase-like glycosyltransferase